MKPHKVLFFVYAVLAILFILTIVFPENGINTACCILKFASTKELFSIPKKKELTESVKKEMKIADKLIKEAETSIIADSIVLPEENDTIIVPEHKKVEEDELKKNTIPLEFNNDDDRKHFYTFFRNLEKAKRKNIRILYYGDSQIEADRITSFIRYKLQKKFGGYGPGMIPPVNFVKFFSMKQEYEGNWTRYSVMQLNKNGIEHNKYGILASFARFSPDSLQDTQNLIFEKAKYSYSNTKRFDKMTLYYGNVTGNVVMQIFTNDKILDFTTLQKGEFGIYTTSLPKKTEKVVLKFTGNTSPDLYAVSFDGVVGISVDNIAIRGCSGTFFTKLDAKHLKNF